MTLPRRKSEAGGAPLINNNKIHVENYTSFEGMIANSQNVLDIALSACDDSILHHKSRPTLVERAIPSILFRECEGIILLHVIEAAFVVGASVGTGLLIKHDAENNTWSAPSAVGLTGISWGVMGGIARKDLVVFIMDKDTMSALSSDIAINLGGQASLTIGERGREVDTSWHASNRGIGATVAFSYSRGFMVGFSLEGSVVATRNKCNADFYGTRVTPWQVLNELQVPSSIKQLHHKLETLAAEPLNNTMQESYVVLYTQQVAQTQTGDESEDETVPGIEPPIEIVQKKTVGMEVTTQVAQTQTEEDFVLCQVAQTQTGQDSDDEYDPPILINKKLVNDFDFMTYKIAETQTDGMVIVQAAQTQTGMSEAEGFETLQVESVMEKKPASLSATFEVAQTQTDNNNVEDEDFIIMDDVESDDEEDMEFVVCPRGGH